MGDEGTDSGRSRFKTTLISLLRVDARKAMVVVLRFFVGLSVEETADALDTSSTTVDNEWRFARAWMRRQIKKGQERSSRED